MKFISFFTNHEEFGIITIHQVDSCYQDDLRGKGEENFVLKIFNI